jgi:hypothetical protein
MNSPSLVGGPAGKGVGLGVGVALGLGVGLGLRVGVAVGIPVGEAAPCGEAVALALGVGVPGPAGVSVRVALGETVAALVGCDRGVRVDVPPGGGGALGVGWPARGRQPEINASSPMPLNALSNARREGRGRDLAGKGICTNTLFVRVGFIPSDIPNRFGI